VIPEDAARVGGGESPVDLSACTVGGLVPEARTVLEFAERRDPIAAGALA
jgi:hypothetical protein